MRKKLLFCGMGLLINSIYATNGTKMIGQTARSTAMGGAGIAITEDASSSDSNPAALAHIEKSMLQLDFGIAVPRASHEGGYKGIDSDSKIIPIPSFSYAYKSKESDLVLGISNIAEGGVGVAYGDGAISSDLAYATLNFTLAYKINEKWSVGATPYFSYSFTRLQLGAESEPEIETLIATGYGIKLGTIYKITDKWNVGLKYTTEDELEYEGDINGKNGSASAKASLSWPSELALGTSYKLTPKLLLAMDIKYINWSDAMGEVDIELEDVPGETKYLDWKDQIVYAIGLEYSVTDKIKLRAGYNYGANPIPATTIEPLLALIIEQSVTAGIGYKYSEDLSFDGTIEYAFDNSQTNSVDSKTTEIGATIYTLGVNYKF